MCAFQKLKHVAGKDSANINLTEVRSLVLVVFVVVYKLPMVTGGSCSSSELLMVMVTSLVINYSWSNRRSLCIVFLVVSSNKLLMVIQPL